MCTSVPTNDEALAFLHRARNVLLPPAERFAAWEIYEGLCWLNYCERHLIPRRAELDLTLAERVAMHKAREGRSKS